MISFSS